MAVTVELTLDNLDGEPDVRHAQHDEAFLNLFLYLSAGLLTALTEVVSLLLTLGIELFNLSLEVFQCLVAILDVIELPT